MEKTRPSTALSFGFLSHWNGGKKQKAPGLRRQVGQEVEGTVSGTMAFGRRLEWIGWIGRGFAPEQPRRVGGGWRGLEGLEGLEDH